MTKPETIAELLSLAGVPVDVPLTECQSAGIETLATLRALARIAKAEGEMGEGIDRHLLELLLGDGGLATVRALINGTLSPVFLAAVVHGTTNGQTAKEALASAAWIMAERRKLSLSTN